MRLAARRSGGIPGDGGRLCPGRRARGARYDVPGALARHERRVSPSIVKKQAAGRRLARWIVPENDVQMMMRDLVTRMAAWPIAWRALRRSLRRASSGPDPDV